MWCCVLFKKLRKLNTTSPERKRFQISSFIRRRENVSESDSEESLLLAAHPNPGQAVINSFQKLPVKLPSNTLMGTTMMERGEQEHECTFLLNVSYLLGNYSFTKIYKRFLFTNIYIRYQKTTLATYFKIKFDKYSLEFWTVMLQEIIFKFFKCELKYSRFIIKFKKILMQKSDV